jgi:hypothetical protein
MRIYQITEAPRIEPSFGDMTKTKVAGTSTSTGTGGKPLTGMTIKHNGVNYQWKGANWVVVDKGKSKRLKVGSIAPKDTATVLNQKASGLTPGSTSKPKTGPSGKTTTTLKGPELKVSPKDKTDYEKDMDKDKDKDNTKKAKKGITKVRGGVYGLIVSLGLGAVDLTDFADRYVEALEEAGGDRTNQKVLIAKANFAKSVSGTIVSMITGIAGGAIGVATATRIFGAIPYVGWLVALIGGGIGTLAGWVLYELAENADFVDSVTLYIMEEFEDNAIKNISLAKDSVLRVKDSAKRMFDDVDLSESPKQQLKSTMKNIIVSDPKMQKAFKLAQQKHRAKQAAS